jgi:hypothetical protein
MRKHLLKDNAGIVGMTCCLIFFVGGLIVSGIVLVWLFFFGGLQTIGNMCFLFAVPLLIIVIAAILAKKYLFGGKK